ncbi:MAG: PD40 domain-containing protein [Chloroflexi bacterium]|nr:PD40 domain-containing protein [Chloroflexota bacterium]
MDSQSFVYPVLNDVFQIDVTSTNKQLLYSFPERVIHLALSPDGEMLTAFINKVENGIRIPDIGQVVVYELQTGQFAVLLDKTNEGEILWSPDNRWLAFVQAGQLTLIDPRSQEQTAIFSSDMYYQVTAAWSPDGQWLAYIRNYDTLVVWNSQTGESTELYQGEYFRSDENGRWGALREITWLPDSSGLLLASFDHTQAKFIHIGLEDGIVQDFLAINRVDYHTREENLQYLPRN